MKDRYKFIGPAYDLLSSIYGGESIHNCKRAMLDTENVKPGDKILIAGVGHGKDAIRAAELGADVTVVDLSETMLRKFQEAVDKHADKLTIRQVHSDILKFEEFEQYDMVIANFFLNVFSESMMKEILSHLMKCAKPNANVVVGDFEYPSGGIINRSLQKAYWFGAVTIFWAVANNAVHNIYNYPEIMKELGLTIKDKKQFSFLGLNCYWSIMGQKQA
jgi:ubiquinone/menaquinone biosynthesis C-methylase UbiE